MKKFERMVFVACPGIFGAVLIVVGLMVVFKPQAKMLGLLAMCAGFICSSIFCVCSLLAEIIEKKKD